MFHQGGGGPDVVVVFPARWQDIWSRPLFVVPGEKCLVRRPLVESPLWDPPAKYLVPATFHHPWGEVPHRETPRRGTPLWDPPDFGTLSLESTHADSQALLQTLGKARWLKAMPAARVARREPTRLRPISLLRLSLLRFLDSNKIQGIPHGHENSTP